MPNYAEKSIGRLKMTPQMPTYAILVLKTYILQKNPRKYAKCLPRTTAKYYFRKSVN